MTEACASWISPKVSKGAPSAVAGRGLIAREAIPKGEVVAGKGSRIVTGEQLNTLSSHLTNSAIQITSDLHPVALGDDECEGVTLSSITRANPPSDVPATSG